MPNSPCRHHVPSSKLQGFARPLNSSNAAPLLPILPVGTTCRPLNSSNPWVPKINVWFILGERRYELPYTLWVPKINDCFILGERRHESSAGSPKIFDLLGCFQRWREVIGQYDLIVERERYHSCNLVTERGPSSKQQQRCSPITNSPCRHCVPSSKL